MPSAQSGGTAASTDFGPDELIVTRACGKRQRQALAPKAGSYRADAKGLLRRQKTLRARDRLPLPRCPAVLAISRARERLRDMLPGSFARIQLSRRLFHRVSCRAVEFFITPKSIGESGYPKVDFGLDLSLRSWPRSMPRCGRDATPDRYAATDCLVADSTAIGTCHLDDGPRAAQVGRLSIRGRRDGRLPNARRPNGAASRWRS